MYWHWYLLGTAALMTSGVGACGGVAVRTGWLLPWLRRRTLRPELWGYGAMLGSAGLLLQMAYGAVDELDNSQTIGTAVFVTSVLLLVAGAWFQLLATRERVDG
ncbi:hypothetical protein [Streptomyces sp. SID12501]|uniref:Uncharacterized protein n=1 Tax=Streptomyces sp. SID12501 TaxID=2706042 RepID=A0A6B3BTC5_9ACTN|nr:hypothetical protein [Streptomyces sp. SID12501]NEC87550.1 hypothetical protein [Streptomyces sp. SID12501]